MATSYVRRSRPFSRGRISRPPERDQHLERRANRPIASRLELCDVRYFGTIGVRTGRRRTAFHSGSFKNVEERWGRTGIIRMLADVEMRTRPARRHRQVAVTRQPPVVIRDADVDRRVGEPLVDGLRGEIRLTVQPVGVRIEETRDGGGFVL